MDTDAFCREIEAYLCRKNDGHLIRIVGPSFEMIRGWAEQGIPLKIVQRGIDNRFERYYANGSRRRPVRIEFCEGDVLRLFDDWRRAVGVAAGGVGPGEPPAPTEASRSSRSLSAHLERVIARLAALRATPHLTPELALRIDESVRELDAARAGGKAPRGAARERLIARLEELDRELLEVLVRQTSSARMADLRRDADGELGPFRGRMPADVFERAVEAAVRRLLREGAGWPVISFE